MQQQLPYRTPDSLVQFINNKHHQRTPLLAAATKTAADRRTYNKNTTKLNACTNQTKQRQQETSHFSLAIRSWLVYSLFYPSISSCIRLTQKCIQYIHTHTPIDIHQLFSIIIIIYYFRVYATFEYNYVTNVLIINFE